jgi:hypothetical protein
LPQVAAEAGYSHLSHLNAALRRATGGRQARQLEARARLTVAGWRGP